MRQIWTYLRANLLQVLLRGLAYRRAGSRSAARAGACATAAAGSARRGTVETHVQHAPRPPRARLRLRLAAATTATAGARAAGEALLQGAAARGGAAGARPRKAAQRGAQPRCEA